VHSTLRDATTPYTERNDTGEIYKSDITVEESYVLENELVTKYGRLDIGTGCLSNRTNGGHAEWT